MTRRGEDRPRNMRPHDDAAVRERRVGDRHLEWRHGQVALADGEVDGVTLVPDPLGWISERAPQPGRGGNDATVLAKVDSRRMTETEPHRPALHVRPSCRSLPTVEHRSEPVEPRVARDRERWVEVQVR